MLAIIRVHNYKTETEWIKSTPKLSTYTIIVIIFFFCHMLYNTLDFVYRLRNY